MRAALAQQRPIVFGVSVYESFESGTVAASGVVPMPSPHEGMLGGHAMLAAGYDDSRRVFIVRNSWGVDWGLKGYCTMPYDYLTNPDLCFGLLGHQHRGSTPIMIGRLLILAGLMIAIGAPAHAASKPARDGLAYPPVAVLEAELRLPRGAQIPKLIPWGGHLFRPYYIGARARGGGRYTVELQLVR
jgi:hypothetical protein